MIIQETKNAEPVDPAQHFLFGLPEICNSKCLFTQASQFIIGN